MDLAVFYAARLDEIEAAAQAAQAADPGPWRADAHDDGSTWQRTGHGAGLVVAADEVPLWDCEGSNTLCMTAATARHVAMHHPAAVLVDVAIRRRLLAEYDHASRQDLTARLASPDPKISFEAFALDASREMLHIVIYGLATVHGAHPDFRESWAPEAIRALQADQTAQAEERR